MAAPPTRCETHKGALYRAIPSLPMPRRADHRPVSALARACSIMIVNLRQLIDLIRAFRSLNKYLRRLCYRLRLAINSDTLTEVMRHPHNRSYVQPMSLDEARRPSANVQERRASEAAELAAHAATLAAGEPVTQTLLDALAALVASALPWRRFLATQTPAPYPEWVLDAMVEEEAPDAAA
jgi:hypothetical protein